VFSLGYVFIESDSPGVLNVEKLKSLGIKSGPLFGIFYFYSGKLKNGEDVKMENGETVLSKDVMGPNIVGKLNILKFKR
jgi:ribonuclease Z